MNVDGAGSTSRALEGFVDGCVQGVVHGWARWPAYAAEKPIIEVSAGGAVVGSGLAVLPRQDLLRHGVGDGACGFAIPLDPSLWENWHGDTLAAVVMVRGGGMVPGGELALDPSSLGDSLASAPPAPAIWPPLPWQFSHGELCGFIDRIGAERIEGWAQLRGDPASKVTLELLEDGTVVGDMTAEWWRKDLEETRQGDGRWSIRSPVPAALLDGRVHSMRLLLADGTPALEHEIHVQLPRRIADHNAVGSLAFARDDERLSKKLRPQRNDAPADIMFTIVVNFYNMAREAERTLASLTRQYQRGIGDLRYEVLCIDNYSDPPLDADWVASFGPEFRLIRPTRRLGSPCAAINEAAAQAAGRFVCIMIDGAHILTPGVLREAWDALTEAPEGIVGLRQWFIGGDQRWLASVGYTQVQEDLLFDKINWPADGYQMFRFGSPIWESPNHWFDGMIESNCLFMPAQLYTQIGGMDEAFSESGGGYANLDLFRRATDACIEPLVTLIGEATFHQFHGGTTTNVDVTLKGTRVRAYESSYTALRGKPFGGVAPVDIRVRGQIRTLQAIMGRQRPLSPARVGVTDKVRPGSIPMHFDEMAQDYLHSAYVECGLHAHTTWLGEKLNMAPSDALTIQDLVFRLAPGRIVTVNAVPGLLRLLDGVLHLAGLQTSRIIAVSAQAPAGNVPDTVRAIVGEPAQAQTLAAVSRALNTDAPVLVLFAPSAGDMLPIDALSAYAEFVTTRSYLVFMGTAFGQPWLGYSKHWYMTAIRILLGRAPFAIDTYLNRHLITTSPLGYLQRIEPPASAGSVL